MKMVNFRQESHDLRPWNPRKDCGVYPGIYTNVATYETWIRQQSTINKVKSFARLTTPQMRGCKDCCKFVKISGTEEQTSRHGYYKMQDQRYDNQVRDQLTDLKLS